MSPVPEKFQAYGEAVCAFLSHATRREKAAVRQELMDHLTDHTQALLDAGCPPEAAETRALAAMGEAQEVGQALNQAFPRRWLVLSRLALAALGLLLTLALLSYVLPLGEHLQEAWAIRQDPLHNYHTTFLLGEGNTLENVTPLEGQSNPLPEGYAPKEVLATLNGIAERIVAVRGNCDAEVDQMVLDFPCLSDFSQVWADGHLLHLSHGHLAGNSPDRPPALPQGSALLTGHTHIKRLELVDDVMYVNPGSTSIPKDGCASYAVYDNGTFALKKLDGKTLLEAGWE